MDALLTRPGIAERRTVARPDFVLLGALVALSALGVLMIFSASANRLEELGLAASTEVQRQIVFIAVSAVMFVLASLISERQLSLFVPVVFVGACLLLLAVLTPVGTEVRGAQRWLQVGAFQLQPSEIAKPALILGLASLFGSDPDGPLPWSRIFQAAGITLVPALLVAAQPDLGTTLVFAFIASVMIFLAGASVRQLILSSVAAVTGLLVLLQLGLFSFRDYQVARLTAFLDPSADLATVGYNQFQSQVTLGSGGLFGKGLFQGDQTNLSFVPHQTTDFIFTAVGEQLGFVGAAVVLFLFLVVVWRLLMIAATANTRFGRLVSAGVAALVGFHVFVNVGMTVGILPVTGLPLPFMSQGGSSMLAMSFAIGVAHSFRLQRSPVPGERRLL